MFYFLMAVVVDVRNEKDDLIRSFKTQEGKNRSYSSALGQAPCSLTETWATFHDLRFVRHGSSERQNGGVETLIVIYK